MREGRFSAGFWEEVGLRSSGGNPIFPDIIKIFLDIAGDKRKMGENKDILEKSEEAKEFIEQPCSFRRLDMRKRDKFDEPFLKYIYRERKNNEH